MWRTRLIAGCTVAVTAATGLGFLVAASFLALDQALGSPVAAAIVGGVLLAAAGLGMLIVALIRPAPVAAAAPLAQAPAGLAAGVTAPTGGVHPGLDLAQLGLVMRNLSPATVIAVVAGVLYGMIRR